LATVRAQAFAFATLKKVDRFKGGKSIVVGASLKLHAIPCAEKADAVAPIKSVPLGTSSMLPMALSPFLLKFYLAHLLAALILLNIAGRSARLVGAPLGQRLLAKEAGVELVRFSRAIDVRLGSLTDVNGLIGNVRFTPGTWAHHAQHQA
jgi:hypothetical protein